MHRTGAPLPTPGQHVTTLARLRAAVGRDGSGRNDIGLAPEDFVLRRLGKMRKHPVVLHAEGGYPRGRRAALRKRQANIHKSA